MFGPIKFIMTAIGLVLIGIAVAILLLSNPIQDLARHRLENAISEYYGAETTIDDIRIVPLEKGIELVGVTVYNPEPFPHEPAFQCERVLLQVDPATLFSPNPTFAKVEVENPQVQLRYDVGEGTNLGALFASAKTAAAADTAEGRTAVVHNMSASDAKVTLTSNALLDIPFPIEISPFQLEEVTPEKPVSAWEASRIFLKTLLLESVSLKYLLDPVAETIRSEFGGDTDAP